jgi:hypothetical protein
MLVIESGPVPLLFSVTVCATLVLPMFCATNVKLVGERPTAGVVPVPARLIDCGLVGALSTMLNVPVREPVAVGLKVTLMAQFALVARLAGQLLVCEKSPLAEIVLIVSAFVPQLVNVTICAVLVVPTFWPVNVKLPGETQAATGTGPTVRPTLVLCTKLPSVALMVKVAVPCGVALVVVTVKVDEPNPAIGLGLKVP